MTNNEKTLNAFKKAFPSISWVKDGFEWSEDENTILWSGEDNYLEDGLPAFCDYTHIDTFGVHPKIEKWSNAQGLYWEAYDAGTYFAYKN